VAITPAIPTVVVVMAAVVTALAAEVGAAELD
jgi:hypothetical protein